MTDEEHTHEWAHPTPRTRADGQVIREGDTFAPTTHELRVWPDRIVETDAAAELECGAETSDGTSCSNPVDAPGERCWQHEEIPSGGEA